jgi:hypothetical protein
VKRRDIHEQHDFFEYVRLDDGSLPPPDPKRIDVAILDMNHSWPNVGHDSLVHAVLEASEPHRQQLVAAQSKVRVISFDVRRRIQIPPSPNGRFQLYVGTGGPGHLDPRQNDGQKPWAQGIAESVEWEAPLFHLFDSIAKQDSAALVAVCHSFGLVCRWSGVARPELRDEKSGGMPLNALTEAAQSHPWFSKFAQKLADRRHFRVVDNRFFDLVPEGPAAGTALAYESEQQRALTMLELVRDRNSGMPRVFGVNHHPEIVDREHLLVVLEEMRNHGNVSETWYRERLDTLVTQFQGERERQSRLTSEFTLLGLLHHHIGRIIAHR